MSNIVDKTDYKLNVDIKQYRPNQYMINIDRYVEGQGWLPHKFFLTKDELQKLQKTLESAYE